MTNPVSTPKIAQVIKDKYPGAVTGTTDTAVVVDSRQLPAIMDFLKNTTEWDFNYLSMVTATDYYQQFEVSYLLVSMAHNHSLMIKTRCERDQAVLPSVVSLWRSADFQEREIYDLLGISFEGHPNLKRMVLWPEFEGHPLRKDYLR